MSARLPLIPRWLLFLLFISTAASFKKRDRCTFQFGAPLTVTVQCQGKQRFHKTLELPPQPTEPIEIIEGVHLLKDALGKGQRSFIVVENRELELCDIHLENDTLPQEWKLMSPITVVNSTVWIRNFTSEAASEYSEAGGLYLYGSSAVVRCSTFTSHETQVELKDVSMAGAIRLTHQSTLSVHDSDFDAVRSYVAAIYGDLQSQLHLKSSSFWKNEGLEGSAVFLAENGNATIVDSLSEGYAVVGESLMIKKSTLKMNKGYSGAALHFNGPTDTQDDSLNNDWAGVTIHDSVVETNMATSSGGGIYVKGGAFRMTRTSIMNNRAAERGGGMCLSLCHQVEIESSFIEWNALDTRVEWYQKEGAGIFAQNTRLFKILQSRLQSNSGAKTGGGGRFFEVSQLDIQDTVVSDNTARDQAGISARSVKNLSLTNVSVADNSASGDAGGIMVVENTQLSMTETRFTSNSAGDTGGAASIQSANTVSVKNCSFEGNQANRGAAALHIHSSICSNVSESLFVQNEAADEGGGILAHSVDFLSVDQCTFTKNTALTGGAFLIKIAAVVHVTDSKFHANEATGGLGGSIMISSVDRAWIQKAHFEANQARKGGGAVAVADTPTVKCDETEFIKNNSTMAAGGGIIVRNVDNVFLKKCHFQQNAAHGGGGAASLESVFSDVDISETRFIQNEARGRSESDGGAMAILLFARLILRECLFRENRASRDGGALYLPVTKRELNRTVDVLSSSFLANHAESGSGGALFFMKSPRLTVDNCRFTTNQASKSGGAILVGAGTDVFITASRFDLNSLKSETVSFNVRAGFAWRGAIADGEQPTNEEERSSSTTPSIRGNCGGAVSLVTVQQFSLMDSILESNTSPGFGGAIHAEVTPSTTPSSELTLYCEQDVERIVSSRNNISNNEARAAGGALYILRTREAVFNRTKFEDNWVSREEPSIKYSREIEEEDGGAVVFKESEQIYLEQVTCSRNHATFSGGAISFNRVTGLYLKECTFENNAAFQGGAIQIIASNRGVLDQCHFTGNEGLSHLAQKPTAAHTNDGGTEEDSEEWGGHGGAVVIENTTDFNLTSPVFQSNKASGHGGALYCKGSLGLALFGSHFLYNSALLTGGAISLSSGNLSLNVDQFVGNKASDGGILSVNGSLVDGIGLETSHNLAQNQAGLVYCHRPSNVSLTGSKFVDDGSLQGEGSSFLAGCDCRLSVLASRIVCSNEDVNGCGRSEANGLCQNAVVLDAYHVIHYNKFWSIFKLIAPALVILPMMVILARLCIHVSTVAAAKAGFYEDHPEQSLVDGMTELWGPGAKSEEEQRIALSRAIDRSVDDSPFWRSPRVPPAPTFDSAVSIKILESHCINEPLLVSPQQGPDKKPPPKSKAALTEPFMKPAPMGQEVTQYAYSAFMGSSFCINPEDLSEESIDMSEVRPSDDNDASRFSSCHPIHEQQDFRCEYDEIAEMRDL